jgi:hypothetical protein
MRGVEWNEWTMVRRDKGCCEEGVREGGGRCEWYCRGWRLRLVGWAREGADRRRLAAVTQGWGMTPLGG